MDILKTPTDIEITVHDDYFGRIYDYLTIEQARRAAKILTKYADELDRERTARTHDSMVTR